MLCIHVCGWNKLLNSKEFLSQRNIYALTAESFDQQFSALQWLFSWGTAQDSALFKLRSQLNINKNLGVFSSIQYYSRAPDHPSTFWTHAFLEIPNSNVKCLESVKISPWVISLKQVSKYIVILLF